MEKLVFYLMNYKGYKVLDDFLDRYSRDSIEYVVTSRDKNVEKDYYEEITNLCNVNNIKVYDRNEKKRNFPGYKIAIGWRWIINDTSNLIVMHDSLLPKYRGFSPLVNMLINGEKEIGVTALFASANYDEGDIIDQIKITIEYPIKIKEAINIISNLYSQLTISLYYKYNNAGKLVGTPQKHDQASYSLWRDEIDYFIDWSENATLIIRTINALSFPFQGAKTFLNNELITINDAEEVPDIIIENREPGKVIFLTNGFPTIVCGKGLILINSAVNKDNRSILPLKKFRSRFGEKKFDSF